ncbi:MAG: ABC transporter substrate-binding protein, partial [Candidatus Rokuibacteriota bacterium]
MTAKAVLIVTLALAFATVPLAAEAQAATPTIGYLTSGGCPTQRTIPAFVDALRERGYVIGKNLLIECRHTDEVSEERFRQFAAELVRLRVALIFAVSSAAVRGVQPVTRTIPVVALDLESDPVSSGLATSIARPGGNVTGVFLDADQMNGKRLQMLRELLPQLARVAILWDAASDPTLLRTTETIVRSSGIGLQVLSVRGPKEFADAFQAAGRQRADAVLVM